MKKFNIQIIIISLILAGILLGMTSLALPKLIPASAPATDFSAERAMEHVSAISQALHPPGSEEIEQVRAYILSQLDGMGLTPEIQETSVAIQQGSSVIGTFIKNIVAIIPGTNSSHRPGRDRAVQFPAHGWHGKVFPRATQAYGR